MGRTPGRLTANSWLNKQSGNIPTVFSPRTCSILEQVTAKMSSQGRKYRYNESSPETAILTHFYVKFSHIWQLRLKNSKLNVLFTVVKIYLTAMSIRAFTTTLVSFAIAYSGWSHVVISILETGTSIRQPQLANLQFCKTCIMQIYLKPPLFLNSSVATDEFRSGPPSASPFSYEMTVFKVPRHIMLPEHNVPRA